MKHHTAIVVDNELKKPIPTELKKWTIFGAPTHACRFFSHRTQRAHLIWGVGHSARLKSGWVGVRTTESALGGRVRTYWKRGVHRKSVRLKMRMKSCNSLQLRNPLPPSSADVLETLHQRIPLVGRDAGTGCTGTCLPKGPARVYAPRAPRVRAGGDPSPPSGPAPPTKQAAWPDLTAGRGHREKGQEGQLPSSRQRKVRGAPFSRTPNNCSSASARGVPHQDHRRQKRLGEGAASAKYRSARSYQPGTQTRTAARKFGHARAGRGQR